MFTSIFNQKELNREEGQSKMAGWADPGLSPLQITTKDWKSWTSENKSNANTLETYNTKKAVIINLTYGPGGAGTVGENITPSPRVCDRCCAGWEGAGEGLRDQGSSRTPAAGSVETRWWGESFCQRVSTEPAAGVLDDPQVVWPLPHSFPDPHSSDRRL